MLATNDISKLGIGTWGMGGFMEIDTAIDEEKQVNAISYQLKKGINIVQANNIYSNGRAVEILGKGIEKSGISREKIFVIQADYKADSSYNAVSKEIEMTMRKLNTDYIDTFQFRSKAFHENTFDSLCIVIEKLLNDGKVKNTSITNPSKELLSKYHERFGDKLFSVEICHNFEIRANEQAGIVKYAQDNNIATFIFQPLRRNRTANRHWPLLVSLAKKYQKTQNQILLAWLLSKGFYILTKTETISHIDQNIAACSLILEEGDLRSIDAFNPTGYVPPVIDWDWTGIGVTVDQLSNVFDDDYDKQQSILQP